MNPQATPASTPKWIPRVRLPLGVKFLTLLLTVLLSVVLSIVWNATELFRKDNLDSIFISTDMLTQAKASELSFWMEAVQKRARASLTADSLLAADPEILGVIRRTQTEQVVLGKSALAELGVNPDDVRAALKKNADLTEATWVALLPRVRALALPFGDFLVLTRMDTVRRILREDGPFQLAAVTASGHWILPPARLPQGKRSESEIPLIAQLKSSRLERQFLEFGWEGTSWLGAFARVHAQGSRPLAVVSFVPKQIALESGDILVERSISIALFALSLSAIIAYLFVLQITGPLQMLRRAALAISRGNFRTRVAVRTRDETLDLAQSFNVMGTEIETKIENLARLNEATQSLSSKLEPTDLLKESLLAVQSITRCTRGLGMFKGIKGSVILSKSNWFADDVMPVKTLLEELRSIKAATIVTVNGQRLLVAPLREGSKPAGYLVFAERSDGKTLSDEDLSVLGTLSSSTNATFEIIQLLRETADKARMERELETAKLVQDTMFPQPNIRHGNWSVAGYYTPAGECGGDWWGTVPLANGDLVLAVGDATGHGVPAALITATARASFSILESTGAKQPELLKSPGNVLKLLNKAVYDTSRGEIMMTFFVAYLESASGKLRFASASHDPVYWHRPPADADLQDEGSKDAITVLEVDAGPRLGQEPQANYAENEITVAPADALYFYTDGLPEGLNSSGKEYGDRKFLRSLARHALKTPAEARDGVIQDFQDFVGETPLADDVTLVSVRFKSA